MTLTDIAVAATAATVTQNGKNFDAMCIVAALSFARDAVNNGTFDTVKYGTLVQAWLLNLKD